MMRALRVPPAGHIRISCGAPAPIRAGHPATPYWVRMPKLGFASDNIQAIRKI